MDGKQIKDTIHAKGIDISIYTNDFQNEFISITDIARCKLNVVRRQSDGKKKC